MLLQYGSSSACPSRQQMQKQVMRARQNAQVVGAK